MLVSGENNSVRWKAGDRLHQLFEDRVDELSSCGNSNHEVISTTQHSISYKELDSRANQLARHLISYGVVPGAKVALLLEHSFDTYATLLAILKIHAAYVPLDENFPRERIAYILEDSEVSLIVSDTNSRGILPKNNVPVVMLDEDEHAISLLEFSRLKNKKSRLDEDALAYVIYTSGTTGNPKGVAIHHSSVCNFVRVAAETYGYKATDRVFQGMTIAFDFSVEELWVPMVVGATLVPSGPGPNLVGSDLHSYLDDNKVTALCCVPTLLATIENDLPDLRLLLVSGEACPHDLVVRWYRKGRTILNAYGPTETTVTATITELHPDRNVTIGKPLPTYTIIILDLERDKVLADGDVGEIGIAGIGLAKEYLHHPELTEEKFIPDFLGLDDNPSKRIYRTGDLGRITKSEEIEYLGRVDTQVKIRGYRIELTEIESAILQFPQVAQAVVDVCEGEGNSQDLVAYYSLKTNDTDVDHQLLVETLRGKLPNYMVPSYFEHLQIIPMTPSNKADRKSLPRPKSQRFTLSAKEYVAPTNELEVSIANSLSQVMGINRVSLEDNFFTDLGAHSLLMAKFCSNVRKRDGMLSISMRDVYKFPTVKSLASFVEQNLDASRAENTLPLEVDVPQHNPTYVQYYICGALQLATYFILGGFSLWIFLTVFFWVYAEANNTFDLYLRIVASLLFAFVGLSTLSIAAKWMLIGRWQKKVIPIWSLQYFRFWLAKLLVELSPMNMFKGTPVYNIFLILLGAKIGKSAVILSPASVCTDMLEIGENTLIKKNALLTGYYATKNNIVLGSVSIGENVFVGSDSVISINTTIENNGQLGHSSTLHPGAIIRENNRYHGTPAVKTSINFCEIEGQDCTMLRRWFYTVGLLLYSIFIGSFFGLLTIKILAYLDVTLNIRALSASDVFPHFQQISLTISLTVAGLLIFSTVTSLLFVRFVPKLLNIFIEPGKTYVLFGIHYHLQSIIAGSSNSKRLNALFGDSSYIVNYLKWVGYNLNKIIQTGSNFGINHLHENPLLCSIGSGSIVSDGLIMDNIQQSANAFRVCPVNIGHQNYLGNDIYYPAAGRTGSNVLIATKTMIPIEGQTRDNTGLLGSPCFEIPRASLRDREIIDSISDKELETLLRRKNSYNIITVVLLLLSEWVFGSIVGICFAFAAIYYIEFGFLSLLSFSAIILFFTLFYWSTIERLSLRGQKLEARTVSMYEPYFLFHERHWKFTIHSLDELFPGTPFKPLMLRLLGVKVGRMVFDDGAGIADRTLISIGHGVNMNAKCNLQAHSLEEGVFKSGEVVIGDNCTLGAGSYVHYSVTMGRNTKLGPNAFLMKGETTPDNSLWVGNPAAMIGINSSVSMR